MKKMLFILLSVAVQGCSNLPNENLTATAPVCIGDLDLPHALALQFEPATDELFLNEALGEPQQGKLCQGRVYQSKENSQVTVYRAWNSTNPHSKFGQWWSFEQPSGLIAQYRTDYGICYQWSPLDKMVKCTLSPNVKVAVGNGQSAQCSEYLTYQSSPKQQVYIVNAADSVVNCTEYDGVMSWQ